MSCPRCAEARDMADELNGTLNAVLTERNTLQARLDAIRAAWRAHDAARSTYLEAWGTAEACETEAERAYYETSQALAALMREP